MSYELTWQTGNVVLRLDMRNGLSLDEMKLINEHVMDFLDKAEGKVTLLIDVSDLRAGYTTVDYLRGTQEYRDHDKLDTIAVVADNRLNRLISLLVFSLSRATFVQFDSSEKAHTYMSQRGYL